jgi:septal ring factor EnvC (AmiA/AmiB activator)
MTDLTLTVGDFLVLFGVLLATITPVLSIIFFSMSSKRAKLKEKDLAQREETEHNMQKREAELKSFVKVEQQIGTLMTSMVRIESKLDVSCENYNTLAAKVAVIDNNLTQLSNRVENLREEHSEHLVEHRKERLG